MLSGVTSSSPSLWHWRRPLTTALNEVSGAICTKPHGDRGPPVQRPRTPLYGARRRVWPGIPSSSRCTRENSNVRGLTRLYEVRPQERDQRHTVEQIVDTTLIVPSLDVPVPQRENQLVEACRHLDLPIPEQAIVVPKISSTPCPPRRLRVRFAEQMAEQLVEVPTIISYSSLRGIMEQNVDIPVPHGRGGRVGVRSLQGFQDRVQQRIVEQISQQRLPSRTLTFQFRVVTELFILHRHRSVLPVTANQGFFSTFSQREKKVRGRARTRGRNCSPSRAHPR